MRVRRVVCPPRGCRGGIFYWKICVLAWVHLGFIAQRAHPRNSQGDAQANFRLGSTKGSRPQSLHLQKTCFQISWIEDEWHLLFVCPLYSSRRRALPFRSTQVLVEGHRMQGAGCTERNLTSLVRHIMALPSIDSVVDFLLHAIKLRRKSRRNPYPFQ